MAYFNEITRRRVYNMTVTMAMCFIGAYYKSVAAWTKCRHVQQEAKLSLG